MTILRIRRLTSLSLIAAVWVPLGLLLIGCTPAQKARAVAEGQLYCGLATSTGPLVVALSNSLGAPILATDQAASVVALDCALINAIPVSPPILPELAPVVAVKAG